MSTPTIRIGDTIKFRAPVRGGKAINTRVVRGFAGIHPTVRAHGYDAFIVKIDEVLEINGREVE